MTEEKISTVLERFEKAIAVMNICMNKAYYIRFSTGIAYFSGKVNKSLEEMIKVADFDVYKQKESQIILFLKYILANGNT